MTNDGRDEHCVKTLAGKPRVKRPFLSRSTNGWKDNIKPNDKYADEIPVTEAWAIDMPL